MSNNPITIDILLKAREFAFETQCPTVRTEHVLLSIFSLQDRDSIAWFNDANIDYKFAFDVVTEWCWYAVQNDLLTVDETITKDKIVPSRLVEEIMIETFAIAIISGERMPTMPHLLYTIMKQEHTGVNTALSDNGITFAMVEEMLSMSDNNNEPDDDEINEMRDRLHRELDETARNDSKRRQDNTKKSLLEQFATNLNKQYASGKMAPVFGRDAEIESIVQVLARKTKNNAIVTGDSGVGKTALVEGLAQRIVDGNVPDIIKSTVVYDLNIAAIIAGTKYRGEFEERMKLLLDELAELDNAVVFIDEIHTIMGAGSGKDSSMDVANLIKPALQRGTLKCIGATTNKEYRSIFEKDHALTRRFYRVNVLEPSIPDAIQMLSMTMERFEKHHKMRITKKAIEAAVTLSARYINDKQLPDKAFDVIDSACARSKISDSPVKTLSLRMVEQEVATMARIPVDNIRADKTTKLDVDVEAALKSRVFGQDHACEQLSNAIYVAKSGIKHENKPIGCYLLSGPTGVGKTEIAKAISDLLNMPLVKFDMSEYQERHSISKLIGAPAGYVGYNDGASGSGILINELEKSPHCVLLLDEVEKAHPDVMNVLLQVMDNGMITSSNGKTVSARNCLLLLTSNLGAADSERKKVGFVGGFNVDAQDHAIKSFFRPEFRNRLDGTIMFDRLKPAMINKVVEKFLNQLATQVKTSGVKLSWTDAAVNHIASTGYDELMGARPLARIIDSTIRVPLAKHIVKGVNDKMDYIIDVEHGNIVLHDNIKVGA